jgi:hypothetical protein
LNLLGGNFWRFQNCPFFLHPIGILWCGLHYFGATSKGSKDLLPDIAVKKNEKIVIFPLEYFL